MRRTPFFLVAAAVVLWGCRPGGPLQTLDTPPVNLAAAIQRANAENKLLVLEFTGSDWCPACIDFHKRVSADPAFQAYAQSNLVWVELNFPEKSKLRPDTDATNRLLLAQFQVEPFPTFIALDREGREIWRQPATNDPNPSITLIPSVFISQIEALRLRKQ